MRILFLFDGLGRGGRERRFVQLVKGLNNAGYNDLYLINTRNILDYTEILNYNINYETMDRKAIGFAVNFIRKLREIKPDIIQPWIDISAAWANIAYYFCNPKPIYLSSFISDCDYSSHALWSKIVMRWSYSLSPFVISNSIAGFKSYKVPKNKWRCIYNGFDFKRIDYFKDHDIRREFNINTKFVVSMVARCSEEKDYPLYIKTALSILKKHNDVTFLGVGGGPKWDEYISLIPDEFKNRLIFTGARNDVEAFYRCSDFTILCSHGEGVSNSILESMAFGKTVIASNVGGTPEIIEDKVSGFLYEPGDGVHLTKLIELLLKNEMLMREMGVNSENRIRIKFSLEAATNNYIKIYNEILTANNR